MDLGFSAFLIRNDLKPGTVKKHLTNYRLLEKECIPICEMTFNEFIARKLGTVSPAAINKYIQCAIWLCRYFNWEWSKSTFKKMKEEPKPRKTMGNEEILSFLKLPSRHKMYWKLLAFHGARPSEIAGLRAEDIDFSNNSITIGKSKTRQGRIVKINPMVVQELKEYIKTLKTQFLFTPRGRDHPISIASIDAEFKVKKKILGIVKPVTPHGFRHSFATRLLQEEQPLFVVMDILGHTSSKTTEIYFHSNLKAQEKAMKNDPLNLQTPEDKLNKIEEFIKNTLQGDTRFNQSLVRESIASLWRSI